MDFREQILHFLNANGNFYKFSAAYFYEREMTLEKAVSLIINVVIKGLSLQCKISRKSDEFHNMAREAGTIVFEGNMALYLNDIQVIVKGSGFNAELFGEDFNSLVNRIASYCGVQGSTVNSLFGLLTPVTLSILNRVFKLTNPESSDACNQYLNTAADQNPLPEDIEQIFSQFPSVKENIKDNSSFGKQATKRVLSLFPQIKH